MPTTRIDRELPPTHYRLLSVEPHGKSKPGNKRQLVTVRSLRLKDHQQGRYIAKAGGKCSGASRMTDSQLAEAQARLERETKAFERRFENDLNKRLFGGPA